MLLCKPIDLDLVKEVDAYINAKETIEYLQNVVDSIETRVINGEVVEGLQLTSGQKRRFITDEGLEYLSLTYGRDFVYKQVEKAITITELDKLLSAAELHELSVKGVVALKETSPKIKITR